MQTQPIIELERVTHAEGADEDVDLALVALVIEEQAAVTVEVVEAAVRDVAEILEQMPQSPILALLDDKVDVAVAPLERRRPRTMPVHANGGAAQESHQHVRLGGSLQQADGLRLDVGER